MAEESRKIGTLKNSTENTNKHGVEREKVCCISALKPALIVVFGHQPSVPLTVVRGPIASTGAGLVDTREFTCTNSMTSRP